MEREGITTADANQHGGETMEDNRFATAGWLSIAMAILILPASLMHLMMDVKHMRWLLPFSAGLDLVILGIGIYVLLKLREWLNEIYDFHGVDTIVPMIIIGNVAVAPMAIAARILDIGESLFYLIPIYAVLAGLSILMIVFAARFLRIYGEMNGLKKPIVYIGIAISACFLTFILIPLGIVLGAVFDLLVGLHLLRKHGEEVEFV